MQFLKDAVSHPAQVTVLLNPDPPYEQAQWQESEPAAPLLEGDDAAGCGLLGEWIEGRLCCDRTRSF